MYGCMSWLLGPVAALCGTTKDEFHCLQWVCNFEHNSNLICPLSLYIVYLWYVLCIDSFAHCLSPPSFPLLLPSSIFPLLSLSLSPCPPLPSLLPSLPFTHTHTHARTHARTHTHTHTHTQGSIRNECDRTCPHNQSCQEDDTLGSEFRGGCRGVATVTCRSLLRTLSCH